MKWLFLLTPLFLLSNCTESDGPKPVPKSADPGAEIFRKNCVLCHGAEGNLGLNGAKDLSKSTLPVPDRIAIITNGKSAMTPFGKLLTPQEIEAVAHYTLTLNKQLPQ